MTKLLYNIIQVICIVLLIIVAAWALFTFVGRADAATLSCSTSQASFTLSEASDAFCVSGRNDLGPNGYFKDQPEWRLGNSFDGSTGTGDGRVTFVEGTGTMNQGSMRIANPNGYLTMIVLKAGHGFAAFTASTADGWFDWSSTKDLSHASLWYQKTPVPGAIPLPAGGLLIVTGMGALLCLRRRKSA